MPSLLTIIAEMLCVSRTHAWVLEQRIICHKGRLLADEPGDAPIIEAGITEEEGVQVVNNEEEVLWPQWIRPLDEETRQMEEEVWDLWWEMEL